MPAKLTLGPVLFNWSPERWRDFYFSVADEAPIDEVYLGEVVCSKRSPFFDPLMPEVMERLAAGGKQVVLTTLAEIMLPRERQMTAGVCAVETTVVEANDVAALYHLKGKPHRVGPFVNVYNELTLQELAAHGARHVTLAPEIPATSLALLAESARAQGVTLEVQVYGRVPLALSARCYHARAHGRTKDNCQFVCEADPDGMVLRTMDDKDFLVVNGVQTLSYRCLNLAREIPAMQQMGITSFRLSPHSQEMLQVIRIFRQVVDGALSGAAALPQLDKLGLQVPFVNGFYYKQPGCAFYESRGEGQRP